jgi:selenocysteine-specific elongation factor
VRLGIEPAGVQSLGPHNGNAAGAAYRAIGDRWYLASAVSDAGSRLETLVNEAHLQAPLEPGVSLQWLRTQSGTPSDLADTLVADLVRAGRLEVEGALVRRAGWTPQPASDEAAALDRIAATLAEAGAEPPSVPELAAVHGPSTAALLRLLERGGVVVQVEPQRYYSRPALDTLVAALRRGMEAGRTYGPAELRELLGVSRKFLIPLLEYADRSGITDRRADGRVIRGT